MMDANRTLSKRQKILVGVCFSAVLVAGALFAVGRLVAFRSAPSNFVPKLNAIPVFGASSLSPVELMAETVEVNKIPNTDKYDVNMSYEVMTSESTSFVLPIAYNDSHYAVDIRVDGVTTPARTQTLTFAQVQRPMGDADTGIQLLPSASETGDAPENLYVRLFDRFRTGYTVSNIHLDTSFWVYDISCAAADKDGKTPSFRIAGDMQRYHLLATSDESCVVTRLRADAAYADYYLSETADTMWLLIAAGDSAPDVDIQGAPIQPVTMSLREVLRAVYAAEQPTQQELYLQSIRQTLDAAHPDAQVYTIQKTASDHRALSSTGLDMKLFDVNGVGKHTITVTIRAVGENGYNDRYSFRLIDSPERLWTCCGNRQMTLSIDNRRYDYAISDSMLDFSKSKSCAE